MSRVPAPGGKSRLAGILTPEQREELQWIFLREALKKTERLPGIKCFLAATPPEQIARLNHLTRPGMEIITQPAGDLGCRMLTVARQLHDRGYQPVVLTGTDTPSLPPVFILEAVKLLRQHDFVFGPSFDGGYYLIGMRVPDARVFRGIPWGTGSVLEQTLSVCGRNNFTCTLLAPLRDIDRPDDLRVLAGEWRRTAPEQPGIPARLAELLAGITNSIQG